MVSEVELSRLQTSINAKFHFAKTQDGRFSVTVQEARDWAGVPVNVGFTIHDHPGNYWRGAAKRLERLMYTRFDGKDSAVAWGQKQLPDMDETAVAALYDEVRQKVNPKSPSAMWVSWVDEVDSHQNGHATLEQPEKPIKVESKQPAVSPDSESPQVVPDEDGDTFDTMFPKSKSPALEPEVESDKTYLNGTQVRPEDAANFVKYQEKFRKDPFNKIALYKAIEYANEKGDGW